jgi:hypothetical protein
VAIVPADVDRAEQKVFNEYQFLRMQCPQGCLSAFNAWVAELVDAKDLKSFVPKGTYRFDSGPGHSFFPTTSSGF